MRLKHLMTLKYEIRERSESIGFLSMMGDGGMILVIALGASVLHGKRTHSDGSSCSRGKVL